MNAAVVLLLCVTALLSSHRGASTRSGVEERTQYCGSDLANVLNSLCAKYNEPFQKRDTRYNPGHDQAATLLDTNGDSKLGFMEAKATLQLLRPSVHHGRHTRGIANVCCHRGCTTRDLLSYCRLVRHSPALLASDDGGRA